MPRGKKGDEYKPSNGATPDQAVEVIDAIEAENERLIDLRMAYMSSCKPHHAQIKSIVDDAVKIYGMSKRAIKSKIKERALLRKANAVRYALDDEEVEAYDKLSDQLGPLGTVARERYHQGDPLTGLAQAS